jgi:hypothetical protein
MAKTDGVEFINGQISILPLSPTNKTHLVVNLGETSMVFHLESWSTEIHFDAIRRFNQMVIELRAAHSIPTSSSS